MHSVAACFNFCMFVVHECINICKFHVDLNFLECIVQWIRISICIGHFNPL